MRRNRKDNPAGERLVIHTGPCSDVCQSQHVTTTPSSTHPAQVSFYEEADGRPAAAVHFTRGRHTRSQQVLDFTASVAPVLVTLAAILALDAEGVTYWWLLGIMWSIFGANVLRVVVAGRSHHRVPCPPDYHPAVEQARIARD